MGSAVLDHVYARDGAGVNIGQVEDHEPIAHANVPFISRGGAGVSNDLHPLEVAGIMVSNNATFRGMAPAATLWSDDFDNNGLADTDLAGDNNFLDSVRWHAAVPPVAKVVNLSYGWPVASTAMRKTTLGVDWWIASADLLFVKSAGNEGAKADHHATVPGDTFNGVAVGDTLRSAPDGPTSAFQGPVGNRWDILDPDSSYETDHGIPKPDLVAPGGRKRFTGINLPLAAGGFGTAAGNNRVGTSYAAAHVSGVAAQLYQGRTATLDHRAMKAALMNAADKTVRDRDGDAWESGINGLDNQLGTGQLDAWGSALTLEAGNAPRFGYTTGTLAPGASDTVLAGLPLGPDSRIVATVTWDRVIERATTPPPPGAGPPPNDVFTEAAQQPHFGLSVTGPQSFGVATPGGSVQHLNALNNPSGAGSYQMQVTNDGAGGTAAYAVAWAISPVDKAPPETGLVLFSVSDQVHERGGDDRIREGRAGTAVREEADRDASGLAAGVETDVFLSRMDVANERFADGRTGLGLNKTNLFADDAIDALSFGFDDIVDLIENGGRISFSVDEYATGLSTYGLPHGPNAVLGEATVVAEAAGDVFVSRVLEPGGRPVQNGNLRTKNTAGADALHPAGLILGNESLIDSYYLGLQGPRLADHEDDLAGLEMVDVEQRRVDPDLDLLAIDDSIANVPFLFFSLDRGSGRAADILVSNWQGENRVYASHDQIGLLAADNLDALLVLDLGGVGSDGWPIFDPAMDYLVFSVDRDSVGSNGTAVHDEWNQGEVPGDLFRSGAGVFAGTNLLFLEATDLGLQEVPLGPGMSWLSDNLDALDIRNVVNGVSSPAPILLLLAGLVALRALLAGRPARRYRRPGGVSGWHPGACAGRGATA